MDKRVRERRRQVNRERGRRRAGLIFLVALVVVAVVAFLWLRSSSVFAVEAVTASATQHVTEEQIAEAAAGARGQSLLKVSTGDIENALSDLPYARTVHVYRKFPNGLDVEIEEYEPAARGAGRERQGVAGGRRRARPGEGHAAGALVACRSSWERTASRCSRAGAYRRRCSRPCLW